MGGSHYRAATRAVVVIAHFDSPYHTDLWYFFLFIPAGHVPSHPPPSCTREKRRFLVLMAQIYTIIKGMLENYIIVLAKIFCNQL